MATDHAGPVSSLLSRCAIGVQVTSANRSSAHLYNNLTLARRWLGKLGKLHAPITGRIMPRMRKVPFSTLC